MTKSTNACPKPVSDISDPSVLDFNFVPNSVWRHPQTSQNGVRDRWQRRRSQGQSEFEGCVSSSRHAGAQEERRQKCSSTAFEPSTHAPVIRLRLERRADQFAPTPDEATPVYGGKVVPSHLEFNREYRSPMGAKSHPAMRNVDYPDPAHALTVIEEQQTSTAGDTPSGD